MTFHSTFRPARSHFQQISVIETLWRLFGEEVALLFWRRYRGSRVYIPRHPPAEHPFSLLLGHERATLLGAEIWQTREAVPLLRQEELQHDSLALLQSGMPLGEIARTLRTTERSVCEWSAKYRQMGALPHRVDEQKCAATPEMQP